MASYCTLDTNSLKSHSMKHSGQQLSKPLYVQRTPSDVPALLIFCERSSGLFNEAARDGVRCGKESASIAFQNWNGKKGKTTERKKREEGLTD